MFFNLYIITFIWFVSIWHLLVIVVIVTIQIDLFYLFRSQGYTLAISGLWRTALGTWSGVRLGRSLTSAIRLHCWVVSSGFALLCLKLLFFWIRYGLRLTNRVLLATTTRLLAKHYWASHIRVVVKNGRQRLLDVIWIFLDVDEVDVFVSDHFGDDEHVIMLWHVFDKIIDCDNLLYWTAKNFFSDQLLDKLFVHRFSLDKNIGQLIELRFEVQVIFIFVISIVLSHINTQVG